MREFTNIIAQDLVQGLRRDERQMRNNGFLYNAYNVKSTQFGLRPYVPPTSISGLSTTNYPFPQIFNAKSGLMLFGQSSVSKIDSLSPLTTTQHQTYDHKNFVITKNIEPAGVWHFVDLDSAYYAFNSVSTVYRTNVPQMRNFTPRTLVQSDIRINTGCEFRGRVVTGGFTGSEVWNNDWKTMFESWEDELATTFTFDTNDIGKNWVLWSSIGGGDFPLWLIHPEYAVFGFVDDNEEHGFEYHIDRSMLMDRIKRNEFGWMPMPWDGEVLVVKPLRNAVMVYGQDGIAALVPGKASEADTFGLVHMSSYGIPTRSCVGGNLDRHVFFDQKGVMWTINSDLQIQRLGYQEFFKDDVGLEMSIVHDKNYDEFHITLPNDSFILTNSGLTRHSAQVITGFDYRNQFTGVVVPELIEEKEVQIVTGITDLGVRGIKRINSLNLSLYDTGDVNVAVDYRFDHSDSFSRTPFVPVNKEGNAVVKASGVDFRFVVESSARENFELDYIQVKWQASDKRNIRGVYVAPTGQEAL